MDYLANHGYLDVGRRKKRYVLLGIALNVGILLQFVFPNLISQLAVLVLSNNGSYLIVCYLTGGLAIYTILARAGISRNIRVGRIVLSILFVLVALVFYFIGLLDTYYSIQYLHLSLIIFILSMILLLFDIYRPFDIITLIAALFITMPIPSVVSEVLMGIYPWSMIKTILGDDVRLILIVNPGLTAVSSVIAVIPLILIIYGYGKRSTGRLQMVVIPLLIFSMGLVADFIRMLTYSSQFRFPEVLDKLFSSTIIYSATLILPIAVYYRRELFSIISGTGESRIAVDGVGSIYLLLSLLMVSAIACIHVYAIPTSSNGVSLRIDTPITSADELMMAIFSNAKLNASINGIQHIDGVAIGNFTLYINGGEYGGVLELVDTPSRLYSIGQYLKLSGYRVGHGWGSGDSYTINYILAEKNNTYVLLAYRVLEISIATNDAHQTMYTRILLTVSAIGRGGIENSIVVFNNILSRFREAIDVQQYLNALDILLPLTYLSIFVIVIYLSIELLYRALNYIRRRVI